MIRSKIAMGFLWPLLALLLHVLPGVVPPAHAQGSRKDDIVFNSRGIPLAGATVRVCAMPASGQPCTPLALIYSDAALTQALANPTTTDGLGNYFFYAAPGKYEIEISGPQITTKQIPNVILPNDPASPNFSAVSAFSLNLSGNLTVNGNTSVIGNLASGTLNLANQSTPPGAAGSGTVNLYTKTADKLLYYKDETGTETGPLGPGAQTNVSNNWSAPQNFNANQRFKGPNPYVDITAFGARAVNPNTAPAATGLTANCTATQTACTISSASTFVNGDGVIIYGAGASHSMSTPSTPTVTPSLALAGTGTLLNTPGPTGSTTYNYKVVARDRNGGLTAASSAGSTTTGAASLGAITVNITSMSRSGQTVTVTTASAHGFLVGCGATNCGEVFIGGGNSLSDVTFRGWFSVTSAADTTHFTFVGPPTTTLGATTSATGGTATYYNCNLVSWSAVTGAVQYYIYSDRANPGTFALVGVSNPYSATGTQDLSWEDYGSPMMDNFSFPAFVPSSAPSSATSDHLSTTIASGAGTTTLTLANAAGTTVTGATIRLDAAPGIAAAAASITAGYGTLYIPTDAGGNQFVVNSWLQLNGSAYSIAQAGALYLNDTVEVTAVGNGGAKWLGDVLPQRGLGPSVTAWSSLPTATIGSAHPGFFFSGSQQALHMGHVQLASVPVNGTLAVLSESGFNQTYDWIDCSPGSGNNDYMSSCFQLRLNPGNNATSNVTFDYVGLAPGGGQDGVSHAPTIYCRFCGNMIVPHAYSVHRGMLYWGGTGGGAVQLGVGGVVYINGGGTPLLTTYSSLGNPAIIGTVVLDTIAHPCVAALTGGSGLAGVQFVNGACGPSSSVLPVSGNVSSIIAAGLPSSMETFSNTRGLVTANLGSFNITSQEYKNAFDIIGPNYASFINNLPMPAPTCSLSSGGSLTVGSNYTFFVVPVWQNGQEGQPSSQSAACTPTSGNQTITINWSTAPGNPKGYDLYYCITPCGPAVGGAGSSNNFANPQSPTATSLVWSAAGFNAGVASGVSRGGPTMLMPGTQGIATPALTFAGSAINPPASGFTSARNIGFPDNSGVIPVSGYQNSAYDNATRANGAIGSNWTVTNNGINISSNNFVGTVASANDVAYWAINAFSPAQFSQVTLTALNGTTDFPGTAVLLSGSGGATHGYNCVEDTTNIFIQKITGTSNSTLASSATTGAVSDILRLEVDNAGNLTCYKNGVSTLTVNDTTYTSGSPGLFLFGAVATAKNWSGGNLHPLSHLDAEQDWTKTEHFTQGIALGGSASESFNNSPRSEQNVFLPGPLTSTWTGSTWTTDKPVTITRVQVQAKTAPSGCATNAVVRLTDGTTPVNVTISSASNDSGVIAQNYAAGASLTVAVQTAAAGCTTSPADANVTVQYRMQ